MKMYIYIPLLKGFDSGLIRSQSAASVSLISFTRVLKLYQVGAGLEEAMPHLFIFHVFSFPSRSGTANWIFHLKKSQAFKSQISVTQKNLIKRNCQCVLAVVHESCIM